MIRRKALGSLAGTAGILMTASLAHAKQTGKPVFGHTDPSRYSPLSQAHGGAGDIPFMELLTYDVFDSNFLFVHRAEIPPKVSIGEHLHRNMEEMYFIFNGVAQFTLNGVTAELPGTCVRNAPDRRRSPAPR